MNVSAPRLAAFDDDTAYERLVLASLTDVERTAQGPRSMALDLRGEHAHIEIGITEVIGGQLAVDAVRPYRALVFGSAYKVLDLLVELVMELDGRVPKGGRWTMADKQAFVRAATSHTLPDPLDTTALIWSRLERLYDVWMEPRHSLVHRRAQLRADGALIGADRAGNPLSPITLDEQDALARAMYWIAGAIVAGSWDMRQENKAKWELDRLQAVHGLGSLGAWPPAQVVPLAVANLELAQAGLLKLDRRRVKDSVASTFPQAGPEVDLELHATFQGEAKVYRVRLEDLPSDDIVEFDPADPVWQLRESNA